MRASEDTVGGLIGSVSGAVVSRAYAVCDVVGQKQVGGFVGAITNSVVSECFSLGTAKGTQDNWSTANKYVGGFAGRIADNADVVAICDKWEEGLKIQKELHKDLPITYYNNFEDFIQHDMDAVVLANYAHEHAPFAIKAMRAGKHVFSEVVPAQTLKEAVELIETVEETSMIYAYGENYCYMGGPYEMRRLYKEGEIGELEYAECEYIHNGETIWPSITYGEPDHWRNRM